MKTLDKLKMINSNIIDKNGKIKTWEKQLLEYEYGTNKNIRPLIVIENSEKISYAEIKNEPIIININTIQKVKTKHNLEIDFLIDLDEQIKNSIFAFDSIQHDTSKIFVTNEINEDKNPIIFILRENDKEGYLDVNRITSIYDKKNLQNLIDKTLEQGGKTYINPKKLNQFKEMDYDIGKSIRKEVINEIKKHDLSMFPTFQDDKILVAEAVKYNSKNFKFASDRLKNDKLFVMELIDKYPKIYEYINNELKKNKEIGMIMAKTIKDSEVPPIDEKLQQDKDIIIEQIKNLDSRDTYMPPDAYVYYILEAPKNKIQIDKDILTELAKKDQTRDICFENSDIQKEYENIIKEFEKEKSTEQIFDEILENPDAISKYTNENIIDNNILHSEIKEDKSFEKDKNDLEK